MTAKELRAHIEETSIIAALRVYSMGEASFAAAALVAGRIPIIEIPLTMPRATEVIAELMKKHSEIVVGWAVQRMPLSRQSLAAGADRR
jgi:2-keto-3-deoxy-6-phosphogluconate aldolase